MRMAIIGTGYVGLVTGTCFADSGNDVVCVDIDADRIAGLTRGVMPIYEPGLAEMVERNHRQGSLHFTTDLASGIADRSVVFVAVGTPQGPTGAADLRALWAVCQSIREVADSPKVVVIKSTVPVGTNREMSRRLNQGGSIRHCVVNNPEFLKEGHAIEDFVNPDRVVLGVRADAGLECMRALYEPLLRTGQPLLVMSPESAEMTKYASNAMLATKISFINELANLCEALGADVTQVRQGIGYDRRIGFEFLYPGAGYGGSCFPKDIRAVMAMADSCNMPSRILQAVEEVNSQQRAVIFQKLSDQVGDLAGTHVAVWGLAFKPGTDDIREAPSLTIIQWLLEAGAAVSAFDPEAMSNVRAVFGDQVQFAAEPYAALSGSDALLILTEWSEFRSPDFEQMQRLMRRRIVVDARNLYDSEKMRKQGFVYASVGRRTVSDEGQGFARAA